MRGQRCNAGLRSANLVLALIALLTPIAHLLELPNKLALSGPLWLAVQQQLYRGWGPFLAGPAEIAVLGLTLGRLLSSHRPPERFRWLLMAALAYAAMIAVFFLFNNPVNHAVSTWTPGTLPSNWPIYRLRWEVGHALAAALAILGLVATAKSWSLRGGTARPESGRVKDLP
jgi:hypothetical protein